MPRPHVAIVGAGFGGLAAARRLARARCRVTVIDRHNYPLFLPLLYQVATAGLEPQDIAFPVRAILRRLPNAVFRLARISGGDLTERYLETDEGERIAYDYLILAAGSRTETYGIPGASEHAFELHSIDEARAFRNHVLRTLERADWTHDPQELERLLRFAVVGGGPTGLEVAGQLAEFRRHVIPRDYPGIDPDDVAVVLIEAGDGLLRGMPRVLRDKPCRHARDLGVEVRLGTAVRRVERGAVELSDGASLPTATVLWAAGVRGAPLAEKLGLARGQAGRISVGESLCVPGRAEVYAIGDIALVEGAEQLPQVAPVAIQQGDLAARNIARSLEGREPEPFRYRDQGQLATIGRARAVASLWGLNFSGVLAWWLWLVVHLMKLVGARNRAVVLVNWAYSYFTYDRGVRSIVGAGRAASLVLLATLLGVAAWL
jgi:NADH dehydrogenase